MKFIATYKIPILYITIGFAFILLNDVIIASIGFSEYMVSIWESVRSWLFVLVSGFVLAIVFKKNRQINQIEKNRDELSALINAMSDFIVLKDANGRWIQLNDYGYELYKLKNDHYIGKSDIELAELYPEYRDHFLYCAESDEKAWKLRKPMRIEEQMEMESETRIFDVIKVPLFDEKNNRKAFFVIGRDISELKQAEELIIKNEKLSVVGQLAAGVAHEIRNPLTSLKGFVQLCKENPNQPKDFYYNIMHVELERINQIVNELLLIAKPQKLKFESQNIEYLLRNVHTIMEAEAILTGVSISLDIKPNLPYVNCEENQLKQVFINIIKNAIEASKEGDVICINVLVQDDNYLLINIIDQGCGIPKERLLKIGEPFFTMKEKGTGLGMTVSYKIIQAHHGKITIDSEVGVGTKVNVLLPFEK